MKKIHGHNNTNSRLHVTWANMKRRCLNPTPKEKRNYKNITICKNWHSFVPFMKWAIANGYSDKLTIDRKDNNKGYFPSNCRFVDYSHQNANRRITNKNKTGYIGVSVHSQSGRYRATVQWQGKQILCDYFSDPLSAAKRRDEFITSNNLPHILNAY